MDRGQSKLRLAAMLGLPTNTFFRAPFDQFRLNPTKSDLKKDKKIAGRFAHPETNSFHAH
jgi:hypothetical protein